MTNHKIDPIEFVKGSQACGDAMCRLNSYLQEQFNLDETESAWLLAVFLHSMPKSIELNPHIKDTLKQQAQRIKLHYQSQGN
ncbi:hypothetical protein [Calothrix sp. 336/3]|uniref:hypothetical protein n=1 Tax=Calothrix sp. 336/3 TaxID=1337936 RepID=UPI0004E3E925|nr:hypothetical protein [Calothrix sp. 336/3]AKG21486.1 hypothetical protein IJ00_09500 [Calothrix sp. 336/3]